MSLERDGTSRPHEVSCKGTAGLRRKQDTNLQGCTKQASSSHSFPPGPHTSQMHPAETYKDSDVSGGTGDGPRWRDFSVDVLHTDSSQMDSCWQPDDHLALVPL